MHLFQNSLSFLSSAESVECSGEFCRVECKFFKDPNNVVIFFVHIFNVVDK